MLVIRGLHPRSVLANICLCASLLSVGSSLDGATGDRAFLTADALLEGWDSNYGALDALEVSFFDQIVEIKSVDPDQPVNENGWVRFQHVDTIKHKPTKRYHTKYSTAADGFAKDENPQEYAFDGDITRKYRADPKLNRGEIQRGLTGGPYENKENVFEKYLCTTKIQNQEYPEGIQRFKWLKKLIDDGRVAARVRPDLDVIAGEKCHVLEIYSEDERPLMEISFAHDKGMLALRYRRYDDDLIIGEMTVEKISFAQTDTGKVWYPSIAYHKQYIEGRGLEDVHPCMITRKIAVHKFNPDPKIDEDAFRFEFPVGTGVVDRIAGLYYVVGSETSTPDGPPRVVPYNGTNEKEPQGQKAKADRTDKQEIPHETAPRDLKKGPNAPAKRPSDASDANDIDSTPVVRDIATMVIIFGVVLLCGGVLVWFWRTIRGRR
jgi:hypothetical protein